MRIIKNKKKTKEKKNSTKGLLGKYLAKKEKQKRFNKTKKKKKKEQNFCIN